MKTLIGLILSMALTACVSARAYDEDKAYSRCASIPGHTLRDQCIAKAITDAERERQREAARQKQIEEAAEQRALDRAIAGAADE